MSADLGYLRGSGHASGRSAAAPIVRKRALQLWTSQAAEIWRRCPAASLPGQGAVAAADWPLPGYLARTRRPSRERAATWRALEPRGWHSGVCVKPQGESGLVGRDAELGVLGMPSRPQLAGHGRWCWSGAEAGGGKSRLVAEFTARVRGGRWCWRGVRGAGRGGLAVCPVHGGAARAGGRGRGRAAARLRGR
jgi:hypothetical protein